MVYKLYGLTPEEIAIVEGKQYMYYFAYGSNMSHIQMHKRCPGSKFISKANLKGYEFVYDGYSETRKHAVGNIVKSPGCVVWGGLFEITEECIKRLDECEGYLKKKYDRMRIGVEDDTGQIHDAIVYFRIGKKIGKPSDEYRKIVIEGARNCGIDEDYIQN